MTCCIKFDCATCRNAGKTVIVVSGLRSFAGDKGASVSRKPLLWPLFGVFFALLVCLFGGLVTPALAQDDTPVAEVLDLSPQALTQFVRLQDGWLEWLAAAHQGDRERVTVAVDRLLSDARDLGMERLPDLSLGAAGQALAFAREDRFEVAGWCIAAAEALDPGRPEVAFAAARVADLEGETWSSIRHQADGFQRLLSEPLAFYLFRADLGYWALFSMLIAGALFVAALMSTRGVELFHDVYSFVNRYVPESIAIGLTLVLMLWPLFLPAGLLWLALYWSVLLWSYGSIVERVILVGLWVVLGFSPTLINEQRQQMRVALAPTVLSMDSLANGRLRGSLFGDLATLREALPESAAVTQLIADLHATLKEWSSAQVLYANIIQEEPENGSALVNLGACYFNQDDYTRSMEYFQRAAQTEQGAAMARFNMSQTLSELYRFREAARELGIAQELTSQEVRAWLRRAAYDRVMIMDGGLRRADEIRDELVATWRSGEGDARWSRFGPSLVSLPLALAFVLIAVALHFVVRKNSQENAPRVKAMAPEGSYRAVFLPGLVEVEDGHPILAFCALFILVGLVSLPLAGELGYRLPWIFSTGNQPAQWLSWFGLGIFFLFRYLRQRSKGL
jgi:tetratricopeptide (TPR) repeat protein